MQIYSLPSLIARGLIDRGITKFTPPQLEALSKELLDGENIVVVAPTASGKTLIGEIALVNSYLKNRKGIYTTPLKALAYEKYDEFRFWEKYGIKIGISVGEYIVTQEEIERLGVYDIIVTTYERLDSILRKRPPWIYKVGTIVIDELHMINDKNRGHIVEMIAVRAKMLDIQIIGLSATVGNPEEIAVWLNAKLVKSNWRPVKLYEIPTYRNRNNWIMIIPKDLESLFQSSLINVDDITKYWILRAVNEGFNVLEFKYSRKAVEELAYTYAPVVCKNLPEYDREKLNNITKQLKDHIYDFEFEKLYPLIRCGVSYHHAGLSYNARRFIEQAFRDRLIKYVAATPTLAMGVNLPARVVIINTRYFSNGSSRKIGVLEYKQLSGRAGRPQYDPYGIVIIAKDISKLSEAKSYIESNPENIDSKLLEESALRKHVLAVLASSEATTLHDLVEFFSNSFSGMKLSKDVIMEKIKKVLLLLEELSMIKSRQLDTTQYSVTKLGLTTSWLYIDPITSFIIVKTLTDKQIANELYYLSLIAITPDFSDIYISKSVYEWFEDYIYDLEANGEIPSSILEYKIKDSGIDWFKGCLLGLILRDWIEEVSEKTIVERYNIELGDLAVIKETAEWLLYSSYIIAKVTGLDAHVKKLETLLERVKYGVKEDALDIVQLKYVGRIRARILLQNGVASIKDIIDREELVLKLLGEGWGKKIIEEAKKIIGININKSVTR